MVMTALEHEAAQRGGAGTTNIRPVYGYYRQPNGWVKQAVMTELEELKYRREGWEPLPQYGRFDMSTEYAAGHPLELLFINGGAYELSEEQIRQQGLYMNPPLIPSCRLPLTQNHKRHTPACWVGAKPVNFPQVAGMKSLGPFPCRFCGVEKPTVEARNQHEAVVHKEEKGDIRTGETLADGLVKGLAGQGSQSDGETAMLRAVAMLTKEVAKLKRSQGSRKDGRSRKKLNEDTQLS